MAYFERKKHPGEILRQRHIEFILSNWRTIAIGCFEGFLKHGRGMWVVNEADFMEPSAGVLAEVRMGYVVGKSLPTFESDSRERKWLAEFNPEKTMLIGFLRQDQGFSSYRIEGRGDGQPKKLWEQSKAKH